MASNRLLPFHVLPEEWQDEAFIAGGFACNRDLANDIDLWVTVPVGNDIDAVRQELLDNLRVTGFIFEEQVDVRTHEGFPVTGEDGYDINLEVRKVAKVTGQFSFTFAKPIHLLVTNGNVDEMLAAFDLSTHQIALVNVFSPVPLEVKGPSWTPPTVVPIVLRDTPTTSARWKKLMDRYQQFRPVPGEPQVDLIYYPFMER